MPETPNTRLVKARTWLCCRFTQKLALLPENSQGGGLC